MHFFLMSLSVFMYMHEINYKLVVIIKANNIWTI